MLNKIFPTILITLDIFAGIMCYVTGDLKKAVYWVAAAVLNITVTY